MAVSTIALLLTGTASNAQLYPFPQQSGVVVTGPSTQPAEPAAPAPKAKPKPKPAPKPATTASVANPGAGKPPQAIVVLVNDDPITAYEIDVRAHFLAMSANVGSTAQENFKRLATSEATSARLKAILEKTIQENQGKTREQIIAVFEKRKAEFAQGLQKQAMESARAGLAPKFRKEAQEELIEERLKLQEAKRNNVELSEDELNRIMKGLAERNKVTEAQFAANMKQMGTDVSVLRSRFAASLAWREVIRKKYSMQISINQRDVDRFIEKNPVTGGDDVELQTQKITLPLPAKLDQAGLAQRLADADGLRRKFTGCKSTGALAQGLASAKFEDTRTLKPTSIPEPTRSLLLNAKEGEMLPPQTTTAGIEVYVVCAKQVVKADDKKRNEAQQELQSREFELMAKRHMRDIRQDAHIEYR